MQQCLPAERAAWIALLRNTAHLNFVVFNGCGRINLLKPQAETHQADWGIKASLPNRRCVAAAFTLKTQTPADLPERLRWLTRSHLHLCAIQLKLVSINTLMISHLNDIIVIILLFHHASHSSTKNTFLCLITPNILVAGWPLKMETRPPQVQTSLQVLQVEPVLWQSLPPPPSPYPWARGSRRYVASKAAFTGARAWTASICWNPV